jgi:hypothetical protein
VGRTGAFILKLVVLLGLELFWLYPASAFNVPGSQNLLIRPSARAAVDMHASLVRSCLPAVDLPGNTSNINLVGQDESLHGGSGSTDYHLAVGTVFLCANTPEFHSPFGPASVGLTFGGEFGHGTTQFNRGTLNEWGVTFSGFTFVQPAPGLLAFGEAGLVALNFASTRSSDMVHADFDGLRLFANAGLIYEQRFGSWVARSTGMLTYATEQTSAYSENGSGVGLLGPGTVPQTTVNMFLGTLEGRLGYQVGSWLPYAIVSVNQNFSSTQGLLLTNGPIPALFPSKTVVTGGVGFEAFAWWGGTFNLETRYLTGSDNQQGWLFNGRVTFKF